MNIILEIKRILQLTKILLEIKVLFIKTIIYKKCTIGPFVGEFGHLLSYVLPFVSYLHSKGVKVIYCGPSIHKHFFYDENKKLITDEYIELRDFYNEVSPNCNELIVPNDLKTFVNKFIENSKTNNIPFWNISDHFFYWNVFCKWIYFFNLLKVYDLSKNYSSCKENSVVIFPRKKGESYTTFYGYSWDYNDIISNIKNLFDKVYVVGHPAFSLKISSYDNVHVYITNDNSKILELCCKSKFIINQFSGTHWLSAYTKTKTIFLFKGKIIEKDFISKVNKMRKKLKIDKILFIFNIENLQKFLKKNQGV